MENQRSSLIPDAAVRAIQDSVDTELIAVGGVDFVTRPVFAPPTEPQPETLTVHTLSGLIDYLSANLDKVGPDTNAVHVVSPDEVSLVGVIGGRPKRRDILLEAKFVGLGFTFGRFYDLETFNIALQSLFVDTGDRAAVLKVVGNVKEESVANFDDDGVTQQVTARAGIARVAEVPVPNPVALRPYRTFPEVEQPESPFVLRLKRREGQMPECALFEADGGKWKLAALESIARHLRVKIAELKEPMSNMAIIA